jgi:integrase
MPWLEKVKSRYYVVWRENGKKHSKPAGINKQLALEIKESLEKQILRREYKISDPSLTFDKLVAEFLDSNPNLRPKTIKIYEHGLGEISVYFGPGRKVSSISKEEIERLRVWLLNKHQPNGAGIVLRPLKTCLNYAVRTGHIPSSPAAGINIKGKQVARFLTDAEIKRLIGACKMNLQLEHIVKIALHTGMRLGEILGIRKEQIRNGRIFVMESKTGFPRQVPIHPGIVGILNSPDFLVEWNIWRLERSFRRAVKRAKLGKLRFHDLRHTFASKYLESGGTIADLREILGHRTLAALQIYAHFQQSTIKERIQAVDFGLGKSLGN